MTTYDESGFPIAVQPVHPSADAVECAYKVGDWFGVDHVRNLDVTKAATIIQQHTDARVAELTQRNAELEKSLNGAYAERNQIVAALSKLYPAGQKKTAIEGWDEAWHNCVYIDLPTGQVSWHIHDREMEQFAHLPPYEGEWDGHDTPEKYRRLANLASQGGNGGGENKS